MTLYNFWQYRLLDKEDKPLIITDGALNVLPNVKTKMHILKNVINFSNRIGIERPKIAVLSATEEVLDSVPSSKEAEEITKLAKKENLNADVFGPLAPRRDNTYHFWANVSRPRIFLLPGEFLADRIFGHQIG